MSALETIATKIEVTFWTCSMCGASTMHEVSTCSCGGVMCVATNTQYAENKGDRDPLFILTQLFERGCCDEWYESDNRDQGEHWGNIYEGPRHNSTKIAEVESESARELIVALVNAAPRLFNEIAALRNLETVATGLIGSGGYESRVAPGEFGEPSWVSLSDSAEWKRAKALVATVRGADE